MNHDRSLYIAFEYQQVEVMSDSPEFLERVRSLFRAMLWDASTPSTGSSESSLFDLASLDSGLPDLLPVQHSSVSPNRMGQVIGRFIVERLIVARTPETLHSSAEQFQLSGDCEAGDVTGTWEEILCCLKYEVVTCFVRSRPDLLWVHAGAIARQGQVVLFPSAGGQGKSTLVTQLCQRGWLYLAEDVVPIDLQSGQILPFPQTPRVRVKVEQPLPLAAVLSLPKVEVNLPSAIVVREALPLGAIVFPQFQFGLSSQYELTRCSPATTVLQLLQNCMNFVEYQAAATHSDPSKANSLKTDLQKANLPKANLLKTNPSKANLSKANSRHPNPHHPNTHHPSTMSQLCRWLGKRSSFSLRYGESGAAIEQLEASLWR